MIKIIYVTERRSRAEGIVEARERLTPTSKCGRPEKSRGCRTLSELLDWKIFRRRKF